MPVHDLRERSFGTWEGLLDKEILARFPEAHTGPWGDDETPEELDERVVDALDRHCCEDIRTGQVLVVSHGGPLRAVLRRCGVPNDESRTAMWPGSLSRTARCAD